MTNRTCALYTTLTCYFSVPPIRPSSCQPADHPHCTRGGSDGADAASSLSGPTPTVQDASLHPPGRVPRVAISSIASIAKRPVQPRMVLGGPHRPFDPCYTMHGNPPAQTVPFDSQSRSAFSRKGDVRGSPFPARSGVSDWAPRMPQYFPSRQTEWVYLPALPARVSGPVSTEYRCDCHTVLSHVLLCYSADSSSLDGTQTLRWGSQKHR